MGMGPLIDLSAASSHIGEFVQLVVFVHRSSPRQNKTGRVVRTDIDVGDETRPYFCISLWNLHLASSSVAAGDILFFRNVKVVQFRSMVEAKSVEYTSILRLIHPYAALLSRGVDDLITSCPVLVGTAKEKLKRVINWVHLTKSTLSIRSASASRNWKVPQELEPHECFLLSQVLRLSRPCKAIFHASIAQVHLHSLCHSSNKEERLFITTRLPTNPDIILEDIICTGCQLCGSPLCSLSASVGKDNSPLLCHKSSNRLHTVGSIYRPFMLYVWDNSAYIPLLVKNKAAEVLFGNIIAEKVYQSYTGHKDHPKNPAKAHVDAQNYRTSVEDKGIESISSLRAVGLQSKETNCDAKGPNIYLIWLILFKSLLLQGKNSSFKFEAIVNPCLAMEDGRFEMMSMSMSTSTSTSNNFINFAEP